MEIEMIAAADEEGGIGKDGKLPWANAGDMSFFRSHTMCHPTLMGRVTFESIGARPLPHRPCAVLTRSPQKIPHADQCFASDNLEELLAWCGRFESPVMVIGGASVYEACMAFADRIFLSRIPGRYGCSKFFPEIKGFELESRTPMDGFVLERHVRAQKRSPKV